MDGIGYLPLTQEEAHLFFRLPTRRYEKAPLILTSNKSFLDWGEIFGDQVPTTAIFRPALASRHYLEHQRKAID